MGRGKLLLLLPALSFFLSPIMGNEWDTGNCVNVKSQLFLGSGADAFEYSFYNQEPDQVPSSACTSNEVVLNPCPTIPSSLFCLEINYNLQDQSDTNRISRILSLESDARQANDETQRQFIRKLQRAEINLEMRQVLATGTTEQAYDQLKLLASMNVGIPYEEMAAFAMAAGKLSEADAYLNYLPQSNEGYDFLKLYLVHLSQGTPYHKLTPQEKSALEDIFIYCPDIPISPVEPGPGIRANEEGQEEMIREYRNMQRDFVRPTMRAYPNPTSDELQVRLKNMDWEQGTVTLSVFDWSGRLVHFIPQVNTEQIRLSFAGQPTGTYLLLLQTTQESIPLRIVVQ